MNSDYTYTPLPEPIPITEQHWPEGTLPLVCTRTMTYNHEGFIRDCIEGILMQKTTFPVRVCIHDDASTDSTASIVHEYQEKYPQLIWGYYRTENIYKHPERKELLREFMTWSEAGKYQALCEGDDYWTDPLKLQKQVEFMEKNPGCSLCVHDAIMLYPDNSTKLFKVKVSDSNGIFNVYDILGTSGQFAPTASYLFRTTVRFIVPRFTSQSYTGDFILEMYAMKQGYGMLLSEEMCIYRANGRNSWSEKFLIPGNNGFIINFGEHQLKLFDKLKTDFKEINPSAFNLKEASIFKKLSDAYLKEKQFLNFQYAITNYKKRIESLHLNEKIKYNLRLCPKIARVLMIILSFARLIKHRLKQKINSLTHMVIL